MSSPSSSTRPVIQPPSESSCMRFRQRKNVVLPHPDGPISAVTVWVGNRIDTSLTTARRPYSAVSRTVSSCRRASAGCAMAGSQGPAGREGEDQDETHQHQRRGPGEAGAIVGTTGPGSGEMEGTGLHRARKGGGWELVTPGGGERGGPRPP